MGASSSLGRKKLKVEELNEVERFLYESYKKIDVDFTFNEITTLKLKLTDDKYYFHTEFTFLLFFNNSIFTENINQIYKNFNSNIESFINNTSKKKFFNLLIIIDDEIETLRNGGKVDFDGLFTVAFERMEIFIMLYIDVTNCNQLYIIEFMRQLSENSVLYRSGRKFDCIYILLPNTDYLIKNSQVVTYITTRNNSNVIDGGENTLYGYVNFDSFETFLKSKYPPTSSNNQLAKFIKKVQPKSTTSAIFIDFNLEIGDFPNENLYQLISLEVLTYESPINIIYIFINNDFSYNPNFDLFINKVISSFDNAMDKFTNNEVFLKIKILHVNSPDYKRNKSYFGNYLKDFSKDTNKNLNGSEKNIKYKFKLEEAENKLHELICKKFRKKENVITNSSLVFEFYEIMDDINKKEPKINKCRKKIIRYKFNKSSFRNYMNFIIVLTKNNYLNKLFENKDKSSNKVIEKILKFLSKNNGINDYNKNNINKASFQNGFEYEIIQESREETVKNFSNNFFNYI